MWALVFIVALVGITLVVLRGSPELARLDVRDGKMSFVSGRLPPRLIADFDDVLSDQAIERATIRIVLDDGRPRVVAEGLTEDLLQQLRNVAGSYRVAQFRTGRRPPRD